jgi:hypothetical protein
MPHYGGEFMADIDEYGLEYRRRGRHPRRGASHGPFGWEAGPYGDWTGYDEEYGRRGIPGRPRGAGFGPYGRQGPRGPGYYRTEPPGYGIEYGYEGDVYGGEFAASRYEAEFGPYRGGRDRYEAYPRRKSRWETDFGDPFHDRERGTPIRMIRGEWSRYDEEYERPRGRWGRQRSRRRGW